MKPLFYSHTNALYKNYFWDFKNHHILNKHNTNHIIGVMGAASWVSSIIVVDFVKVGLY